MQHIRKQLAECRGFGAARSERKIKSRELERARLRTRVGRSARRVVLLAAFRIAQRLVRFGDPVEQRFGLAVTRVDPRVIPPGQPRIRPLDLGRARARREAEDDVKVHIKLLGVTLPWVP